jgi:hypothetical protein
VLGGDPVELGELRSRKLHEQHAELGSAEVGSAA